jgi:dihydropteroate synthase
MQNLKIETDSFLIMGILNVTPDSFSDGGKYCCPSEALDQAKKLIAYGGDIIDIGAESTRPGAELIDETREWSRLKPILETITKNTEVPLSVDTRKANIAAKALKYPNVLIINDVSGLEDTAMATLLAEHPNKKLVINHHFGLPVAQTNAITPKDILKELITFFEERLERAFKAKMQKEQIILDPGLGFGKGLKTNLTIIKALPELKKFFNLPILLGASRKRFISELWGSENLDIGSAAIGLWGAQNGANIIRCHAPASHLALKKIFMASF